MKVGHSGYEGAISQPIPVGVKVKKLLLQGDGGKIEPIIDYDREGSPAPGSRRKHYRVLRYTLTPLLPAQRG